jgi:hypothetical protein
MGELPEYVDGLPNLCGSERLIEVAIRAGRHRPVFLGHTSVDIAGIDSAFAVALHMHQPLIPAGGPDLPTAAIVSNLQWMLEHPDLGDNHNATVFHRCYKRMGELIPQLLAEGGQPRIMLEYSGTLLHGCDALVSTMWSTPCDRSPATRACGRPLSGSAAPGATPSPPPPRCRTTGCTWAPGSTTSRRASAWRRSAGCAASRPRRWRCPTTPTLPTRSSRPSTTVATGGCWFRSTPSSCPTAGRWSARTCPTAWSAPTPPATPPRSWPWSRPKAATPSSSARCNRTPRPEACPASSSLAAACRRWSPRSPTARSAG